MLLIILNSIVVLSGLGVIIIQFCLMKRKTSIYIDKYRVLSNGYLISIIGFISIILSFLSIKSIIVELDSKKISIAVSIALIVFVIINIIWYYLKGQLSKLIKNQKEEEKLIKLYLNFTIYNLVYAFSILFYIIIILNFWGK